MATKAKIHKWCLQVDFENGDGPELYRIGEKEDEQNFLEQLQLTTPPPKVSVVGLTKSQWDRAVRVGKELEG